MTRRGSNPRAPTAVKPVPPPNPAWSRSAPEVDAAGVLWVDASLLVDLEAHYQHHKLTPATPPRVRFP